MAGANPKVKPLPKLGSSTPHAKGKQVAAKYLTTPRNKKCLPNPNSFRSVQNPKSANAAVPRNRMVAKALVFGSPKKKAVGIKTSSELRTPLTKICERMKKLEITSQRKHILGNSNKLSKDIGRNPNTALPVDPSRRQLGAACRDKNKANELFSPPNCKKHEPKSLRGIKKKSKGGSYKPSSFLPKEMVENDSSDMEFDLKSREGSVLGNSRTNEGNAYEEHLETEKASGSFDSIDHTQEESIVCVDSDTGLSDLSRRKMNSSSNSEEGCLEEHGKACSVLGYPRTNEENANEECLATEKASVTFDYIDHTQEKAILCVDSDTGLSDLSKSKMNSSSNSEKGCLEEQDFSANPEEGNKSSEGIVQEEKKTKENSEKREKPEDHRCETQTLGEVGLKGEEAIDNDDKENTLASYGNRCELVPPLYLIYLLLVTTASSIVMMVLFYEIGYRDFYHNSNHSERKMIGKQEMNKITKDKKEGLTTVATGAQGGMKYKKPKPTNPKPFRLRTDERGILKEANLEKRMQSLIPQKGTVIMSSMLPGRISYKRHANEIHRNAVESKWDPDVQESSGSVLEKFLQKDEPRQIRTVVLRTPEGQMRQKVANITPQRRSNPTVQKPKPMTSRLEYGMDVKSENSLRKTRPPSLQGQQFLRPNLVASMAMASHLTCGSKQLSVIKEESSTPSRSEEANKAGTSAPRSLLRGKRPVTIPKEPNFHSIHVPKSCTRKVAL
ncbi:hypothetical protein U1Q18_035232 [Sarracenia purpurea var. burkii]